MSRDSISEQNLSELESFLSQHRNEQEDDDKVTHPQVSRDEGECKTPTSVIHKIPTIERCPPTPKKKAQADLPKIKFPELEFFETKSRVEIESFFRSNFQVSGVKRRPIKRSRSY
ncbi:hypothetical protein K2173_021161 [Erythroxylum novogranatense]|uniref:Cyclin-dependent protein kinase inhibitor SMR2 n=1 Tax=Erythroxylum novogranatense TaxID=1862640 RepID=A0AAV8TMR9_9ROSI|nr:hypothetical protein K2173_021161 [Erythroxylum novogranatense]